MTDTAYSDRVYTLDELRAHIAPIAQRYGLLRVRVFGSYARGEATPQSDVDLLVETDERFRPDWGLCGFCADVEDALAKPVDVVTLRSLLQPRNLETHRAFRTRVCREGVALYEG